jgi:hypothetical protein
MRPVRVSEDIVPVSDFKAQAGLELESGSGSSPSFATSIRAFSSLPLA